MDHVIALHSTALGLNQISRRQISCRQLLQRGVELAQHLGYKTEGIKKGSYAARGMSLEARACGGGVYGLQQGGVTASLQSIGANGYIKPQARDNLAAHMRSRGLISERDYLISIGDQKPLVVVEIPSYFSSPTPDLPMLVNDYRKGGYNHRKAETMLADTRGVNELVGCRCDCSMRSDEEFVVHQIQRIENKQAFERFKAYETSIAQQHQSHEVNTRPFTHDWLDRLADRNQLSKVANTVYLLHGTSLANLESICRDGLQTRFSLERHGIYGRGLYFTNSSCKAFQYAKPDGCIIICRVVLGEIEVLPGSSYGRVVPSNGFESTHAKKGYTEKAPGELQVHDEYIVYHPAAVYPEFVLRVSAE
jgi:hypothetical protein